MRPALAGCAMLAAAIVLPLAAFASDDDERPAYMIYVDPETGKYTTEDPLAVKPGSTRQVDARPETPLATRERYAPIPDWYYAVGAAGLGLLLIAGTRYVARSRDSHDTTI